MQVMLMRLMSKGEYIIVPKGTKFTGSRKLGLKTIIFLCSKIYGSSTLVTSLKVALNMGFFLYIKLYYEYKKL